MKTLTLTLLLAGAALLTAQDRDNPNGRLTMPLRGPGPYGGQATADHMIVKAHPIVQLTGNVKIRTAFVTITADEAIFHEDTGVLEPRGNVRIEPYPPRPVRTPAAGAAQN